MYLAVWVVEVVDVLDPVHPEERLHLDGERREADRRRTSSELGWKKAQIGKKNCFKLCSGANPTKRFFFANEEFFRFLPIS